jgi:hypothetical protein
MGKSMYKENESRTGRNGNSRLVAVLILLLCLAPAGAQLACSSRKLTSVDAPRADQKSAMGSKAEAAPGEQKRFIKIALLSDRSGSIDSTRTPAITAEQLEELIAFLRRHSGEIAFGFIDDDSNQPFVRLRIERRQSAPPPPEAKNNPYEQEKFINQYKAALRQFRERDQQWQTETDRRVEAFMASVRPMLACLHEKGCRSGSTDVVEGLKRADLFLAEPEEAATKTNILLLVTDGLETVRPNTLPPALRSKPRIILVNGSASLGILQSYDVVAVEGIDAAIRRVVESQPEAPLTTRLNASPDGNRPQ